MRSIPVFRHLSDAQLVDEVDRLAQAGRDHTVELIASLEELDRRQLFLPAGYRSMYMYCTRRLLLSEGAAYAGIEAARASRRFPVIFDRLADGSISLATIGLIARHLTASNHLSLLNETRHRSKREVECIVARIKPKPDVPTLIRKVPQPAMAAVGLDQDNVATPSVTARPTAPRVNADALADSSGFSLLEPQEARRCCAPAARPVIAPLAPERFKLQITMDRETHDTLREIQDLIRHALPSGDAAVIVARALKLLREQLLRRKAAQVKRPRLVEKGNGNEDLMADGESGAPPSRLIPADVRRAVWERDGGQCAFVGTDGRCAERGFLEFHHVEPFAAGGGRQARNIELRCRTHNDYEAQRFFGSGHARHRRA